MDDERASAVLGVPSGGLAYWVAAIRECFEETGILLAWRNGCFPDYREVGTAKLYATVRNALLNNEATFAELLARNGLRPAAESLQYFAHWITPEGQPRRYDTRFFLASAPQGQAGIHDGSELTESCWVSPADAIRKAESREWTIVFPTMKNLMLLCNYPGAEAALAAARAGRVRTIQPRVVKDGDGVRFLLPEDEGYEQAGPPVIATTADMAGAALKKDGIR
jgi:8-oxo-dGTP pyrophosphatase MutT (NUDIX family)